MGTAQNSGGTGAPWHSSLRTYGRQIHAKAPAVERLLRAGGSSWPRTASRSGRAISSRFRLFGFARFSSSSSSTTVPDRLCPRGSTAHPNAYWLAQQMVEACGPDTTAPRFLIHDRDRCFGAEFDRRVASLGVRQVRTPVKAPKANAIAERWVRSIRNECLDHRLIFGRRHLQRTVHDYADYYNRWRPHRSLGQRTPCRAPW